MLIHGLLWLAVLSVIISSVNGIPIVGSEMEVFILSGQSNMAGRGGVCHYKWDHILPEECHPHPSILRLDAHLNWVSAHEPLHADIDKKKVCGIGPGMVFANAILKEEKKSLIGLVPCAIGGTPIKEWEKGSTLYNNMIARTKAALQGNNGAVLRALLWYQGESDAEHESTAKTYQKNVEQLFNNIRSDLQSPNLLIIQVAITREDQESDRLTEKIRQAQFNVTLPNVYTIDAKGLPLKEDKLHLTTKAQVQLGKMLASEYLKHVTTERGVLKLAGSHGLCTGDCTAC